MSHPQYHQDFYAWALHSAKLLREGKFQEIDIEHLAEEVESMGAKDKRVLIGGVAVLISYLLKWKYNAENRCRSWRLTIKEQRIRVKRLLADSPNLNHELDNKLTIAYEQAVIRAAREADLPENIFPEKCPFSLEQCSDENFFPE